MVEVKAAHDKRLGAYTFRFRYGNSSWPQVKGIIDIIKVLIPASDREYNPATKEWTILDNSWVAMKEIFSKARFQLTEEQVMTPEDFHYDYGAPSSTVVSKDTLAAQLASLLNLAVTDLADSKVARKAYLKAAMQLHPDRNGGDGSKMSELNSIWSAYNA